MCIKISTIRSQALLQETHANFSASERSLKVQFKPDYKPDNQLAISLHTIYGGALGAFENFIPLILSSMGKFHTPYHFAPLFCLERENFHTPYNFPGNFHTP